MFAADEYVLKPHKLDWELYDGEVLAARFIFRTSLVRQSLKDAARDIFVGGATPESNFEVRDEEDEPRLWIHRAGGSFRGFHLTLALMDGTLLGSASASGKPFAFSLRSRSATRSGSRSARSWGCGRYRPSTRRRSWSLT